MSSENKNLRISRGFFYLGDDVFVKIGPSYEELLKEYLNKGFDKKNFNDITCSKDLKSKDILDKNITYFEFDGIKYFVNIKNDII